MFRCPHCHAELKPETLAAGAGAVCPDCGVEVDVELEDFNLSSLGGSPADVTARPAHESSLGGSSFALSDVPDSELESDGPSSGELPNETLEASSGKPKSDLAKVEGPEPVIEATLAFGSREDDDVPLMLGDESEEDDFADLDARSPGESLNATVDFGHFARLDRDAVEDLAGPGNEPTVALGGKFAPPAPRPVDPPMAPDLTQMVGAPFPIKFPGARSSEPNDATLAADSDRAGSGVSDSSLGRSSSLVGRDSSGERTESPSTHSEQESYDRNSATLAFDSERRSDRSPTPEPIDITGLSSGNTIPRGPLEGGRGASQLGPGDSQVVGDESVRLRAFLLSDTASNDPATIDYAIEGMAGKGGMGVVYKARQQSLNRLVAIKQIKTDMGASASDLNKFISEAVITGQLEHPNIAPVHDLGLAADGLPFYAMKFVEGRDWEDSIKDLTEDENLAILIQVAQAIAFAHSKNVLHRDLKPGNVRLGSFGEVLVMDWGLAARLDDGSEIQPAGTPIYMPPETALEYLDYAKGRVVGRKIDSSRRRIPAGKYCDVYLLGALLFKIVTGRAPHRGKSTFECLRAAAKNEIVKVRRTSELLDIAYKAMATDPEHRHESALEFIDAIKAYQSHAQSIKIARRASQELRAAEALREEKQARATDLYASYSRAQHGYQNALELWSENKKASRRLKRTLRNFAEAAYGNGDYDLALSLLDEKSADDSEMRVRVLRDQKSRANRLKWFKTLQYSTAANVLIAITLAGVVAYLGKGIADQRKEAVRLTEEAIKQTQVADEKSKLADEQARRAEEEARRAEEQSILAESAQRLADQERKKADREKEAARQATQLASEAAQAKAVAVAAASQAERLAKEQGFYAAIGSISAALSDNGAYAASKLLGDQEAKLTEDQRKDPLWVNLRRSADWRDEASEIVGEAAAAGPTLVAATPDGVTLVTASAGKLSVYQQGADKPTAVLPYEGNASQVAVSADGLLSAIVVVDEGVTLLDLANTKANKLPGLKSATRVAFAPVGGALLVGHSGGQVDLWSISGAGATRAKSYDKFNDVEITAVGYSPNGKQRFSADRSGRIVVWRESQSPSDDLEGKEAYSHTVATGTKSAVVAVAMTNDESGRLAYGCEDGSVYELAGWWPSETAAGTPLTVDGKERARPATAARLPSGFLAAKPTRLRATHPAAVTAVAYDDEARIILSSGGDTLLVQRSSARSEVNDEEIEDERRYHDKRVLALSLVDGQQAVSSDESGRVVRWKIIIPPDEAVLDAPDQAPVAALRYTTDVQGAGAVVVADESGFVHRWKNLASPAAFSSRHMGHAEHAELQAWRLEGDQPRVVTVAPEEQIIDVIKEGADPMKRRITVARACVWDGETGMLLRTIDLGERTVVDCDTQRGVLYASAEGRLIDPSDTRPVAFEQPLDGSPESPLWTERTRVSQIRVLDGAPGGATLAVGMRDGQVFLWGPSVGRMEIVPSSVRPHWTPVRSLAYDRVNHRLASGDNEGRIALFSLTESRVVSKRRLTVDASSAVAPVERLDIATDGSVLAVQRGAKVWLLNASLDAPLKALTAIDADLSDDGASLTLLKKTPDDSRTIEQLSLRLAATNPPVSVEAPVSRLVADSTGWLAWGAGFAEWRPSDGGRYGVACRVVSRPQPVAILADASGEGTTALTSEGSIDRWDATGRVVEQRNLPGRGRVLAAVQSSEIKGWLLARENDEDGIAVEHWDPNLQERLRVVMRLPRATDVALTEAGGVAMAASAKSVSVSQVDGGAPTQIVKLPAGLSGRLSIAAHPRGDGFVVASAEGIEVVGAKANGDWRAQQLDRRDITAIAYTPVGDRLIAGIDSGRVLLLDLANPATGGVLTRPLLTYTGHSNRVTHLGLAGTAAQPTIVSGDASGRVVIRPL